MSEHFGMAASASSALRLNSAMLVQGFSLSFSVDAPWMEIISARRLFFFF